MTPDEALHEVRRLATQNRLRYTRHARERMAQRGAQAADVRHALRRAESCSASADAPDRWVVRGPDLDDDELSVVVVIEDDCVVITLY